ncbi:MAG: 3-isopropylmalate dehydratase large subunit [Firmicutes bacterium]|nr:3-isopropylmalate dehydratase large subunit [Bacillota bacterium]
MSNTAETVVEKILGTHCGYPVKAGDVVVANIDLAMATDGSGPLTIDIFYKMGKERTWDSKKVLMVIDHYVPCPNDKVAGLHDIMRDFCKRGNGILLDLGEGICHQLLPEKGYIKPGEIIVGGDSHTCTYGALNTLGTGIGSSDLAVAMATGKLWFRVPETIKVVFENSLPVGVTAKDVALYLVGKLGARGAIYKSIEFHGSSIKGLDMDDRLTICNMVVETGAKCGIMPFDSITENWLKAAGINDCQGVHPDEGANYEKVLSIDLGNISPQIAVPHRVDNVLPAAELEGTRINMVVIGTCTNGRLKDLEIAANILKEHRIAQGVEVIVVPASRKIYVEAARKGILELFVSKGAMVLPPGCGPCCGSSAGIPGDGENVLSTANRNFLGRMGNIKSEIFLGSPLSAIAAAITGKITDPRRID